jgi:hypothetical protein
MPNANASRSATTSASNTMDAVHSLLPTPAASCAAGYAWGEDGSNQCPASYYRIVNAAACESAAAAAGKSYRGSFKDHSAPRGCFLTDIGFYLNVDEVGAGERGAQLLCSGATRVLHGRLKHHRILWYSLGYYGGTQVSRIGAQGGARRGTWSGTHGLSWLGLRAAVRACKGCSGYSTDRRGTNLVLTMCTTSCVHPQLHQAEGGPIFGTTMSKSASCLPTCTHAACPPWQRMRL